ncbi:hypothetical protein OAV71_05565 [Opitutales bacterium]|nr:hypothetical protein [Opitutales bacterium]
MLCTESSPQSLDTLMVYLRSISEYPLSRVNGWAGLLGQNIWGYGARGLIHEPPYPSLPL